MIKPTKALFAIICAGLLLTGCGPSESDYKQVIEERNKLKQQVSELERKIEDIKNAPPRLLQQAKNSIETNQYDIAMIALNKIINDHPDSAEFSTANSLAKSTIATIEKIKKAEEAKKEQEQLKLAKEKQREEAKRKNEIANALRNLKKDHDSIENITWYKHKNAPTTSRGIYPYIGQSGNSHWLRMVTRYKAEDWLFIDQYTVSVDGVNHRRYGKFERDHGYGTIWEWNDVRASPDDIALMRDIANSKKTVIRFHGNQYYSDYTVPSSEKRAIKETLIAFETLSNPKKKP